MPTEDQIELAKALEDTKGEIIGIAADIGQTATDVAVLMIAASIAWAQARFGDQGAALMTEEVANLGFEFMERLGWDTSGLDEGDVNEVDPL